MAQYEADKIIQLLQFCSWKAQTDMTHTGLQNLTTRLGSLPDGNEQVPNEKYLIDLYSDANMALKKDGFVMKRESYINLLLSFGGFERWNDWLHALPAAREYVYPEKVDFAALTSLKIAVWYPETLQKQFKPLLTNARKTTGYGFQLEEIVCKEEAPSLYAHELLQRLEDYAFIIWAIPLGWKDQPNQMKSPTWQSITETSRIIPVWINTDSFWETKLPFVPALKQEKVIAGIPGLLTSLLFIQEILKESFDPDPEEKLQVKPVVTGHHFHDLSSGFFNQGAGSQTNTIQHIGSQHYSTDKYIPGLS